MMEANSLRLDNYLSCDFGIVQLSLIARGECIVYSKNVNTYVSTEVLQPIPLTEDILLKCGFKDSMLARPSYVNGLIRVEPSIKMDMGKYWVVRFRYSGTESAKITELNSLHQLQNLVYSLTGQELTVNL